MILIKQLKDAEIDNYAIQLLVALICVALGGGNLPKMGKAFELNKLKAAYVILNKFENFGVNKEGLLEIKNMLFARAIRRPDKYIIDMGAALNMMIIQFEKNSSLRAELEQGIVITINYLIQHQELLEESGVSKTLETSSSAVALSKRKIGLFAGKQHMLFPKVSTAKKQRIEKEATTAKNESIACTQ